MAVAIGKYKLNDFPLRSDTAIIVTSYGGHRMFLKNTLENYMKTGAYVICSYDSHSDEPKPEIMRIPNSFVFKHETFGNNKRIGWLWDIVYAGSILRSFSNIETVFTVNSDCIWEKPKDINKMVKLLGDDCDLMPVTGYGTMFHTCAVIYKSDIFYKFVDYICSTLKNNIEKSYSPEVVLREFINQEDVKIKHAPIQPMFPEDHRYGGQIDHYSTVNQDSTWKRILGYRNLGGELRHSSIEHLEPPNKKYFDISDKSYYSQHELVLLEYFKTNDRRWLYKFWAEGEDSFWNRRYNPIEYYGEKRLNNDSLRKELGPPSERMGSFSRRNYQSFILKDDKYYKKWKKIIERDK